MSNGMLHGVKQIKWRKKSMWVKLSDENEGSRATYWIEEQAEVQGYPRHMEMWMPPS